MQKLLPLVLLVAIASCTTRTVEQPGAHFSGDLFFKLISFGSMYQADSLTKLRFNQYLDSLKSVNADSLSADDHEMIRIFGGLQQRGLLEKPFFDLRIDSMTTYIVYVDPEEFTKIRDFKRQELITENKKVKIELTGDTVNLGTVWVIDCKTIDKVEKVDGKTYWKK